jgi:tripartite-type tricarboxylate transporter receptor subunit TctC
MKPSRIFCTAAALALGAVASMGSAHAQAYPNKPVTVLVPFSAGGDADQAARNLAVTAQAVLGQPIVVLNKAGANGAIGSIAAKEAAPDGYTLLLARVGSQSLLPALRTDLKYKWNDFTFIGLLELNPVVCVVHPDSPYKTLADLTQAIRRTPGKLNYSNSGPATVQNLAPQLLFYKMDMKPDAAQAINYKGGGEVALAVMSREVDFACNNLSSMVSLIQSGKLRALVTTTPERVKQIPDVPTAREAGFPDLEAVVGWSALYGPPKMNPEAVKRWAAVLQTAAKDARWVAGNDNYGGIPRVLTPEETEKYVAENFRTYQTLGQKIGIQMN